MSNTDFFNVIPIRDPSKRGFEYASCGQCEAGLILAISRDNMNALPYAFKCTCPLGFRNEYMFPVFDWGQVKNFHLITKRPERFPNVCNDYYLKDRGAINEKTQGRI